MSNSSPLEIERYFFTLVHVEAIPDNAAEVPHEVASTVELAQSKNNLRRYLVKLNVTIGYAPTENPNYRCNVGIMGYFRVADEYRDDPGQLAAVTGASILFGAVRELIATVTARGPWPAVSLPSISFRDLQPDVSQPPPAENAERSEQPTQRRRKARARS